MSQGATARPGSACAGADLAHLEVVKRRAHNGRTSSSGRLSESLSAFDKHGRVSP